MSKAKYSTSASTPAPTPTPLVIATNLSAANNNLHMHQESTGSIVDTLQDSMYQAKTDVQKIKSTTQLTLA